MLPRSSSSSVFGKLNKTSLSCCNNSLVQKASTLSLGSSVDVNQVASCCLNNKKNNNNSSSILERSVSSTIGGHSDDETTNNPSYSDVSTEAQYRNVLIVPPKKFTNSSIKCPRTGEQLCQCYSKTTTTSLSTKSILQNQNDLLIPNSTSIINSSLNQCPRTGEQVCRCYSTNTVSLSTSSITIPTTTSSRSFCTKLSNFNTRTTTNTNNNVDQLLDGIFPSSQLKQEYSTKVPESAKGTDTLCPRTGNKVCHCSKSKSSMTASSSTILSMSQQHTPFLAPTHSRFMSTTATTTTTTTPPPPLPGTVVVSIDDAYQTTKTALEQIGWDESDASLQAEIMVAAELCGNNQGLVKMYQPTLMAPTPNCSKPVIERDSLNSAVVNANQSPGMLAAITAADLAIDKLVTNTDLSISIVSSYNTSTSSGQLAFYVERIAQRGFVGIAMCNSPEFVSPTKGAKGVFGTNPLAVGIPLADSPYPFTFDMATSAIALFGVLTAKSKGEALPDNVAYDKDGNWTTDASQVLDGGAIATFGGHKGMGLSLCVELLAGALSGSAVLGQVESKKAAKSWGHTFIAIRPEMLVDDYPTKAKSIIDTVKKAGPSVRIPGERSAKTAIERKQSGYMPIPEKIWESISNTAVHGLPSTTEKNL